MRPVYFYLIILSSAMVSCVSTGKFKAMQQQAHEYDSLYTWSMRTLKTCQDANNDLAKQKTGLQNQMNSINLELTASKENTALLRKQLQDLSSLSSAQAESIKKSLDNIGAKDVYFQELQSALSGRNTQNMAALMDLKASVGGFGEDVKIKVEKGAVYVDISDKMLFDNDSNSYKLSDKAKQVIGRLARVLNDQPNAEVIVEGHTDSIAYPQDPLLDNWDLSVKRATTVVRALQNEYNISPIRMTAAGRSEYITVDANDTPEGRAANRRTRIVILPQTDQLLKVLEHRQGHGENPAPDAPATSGS